MVGLYTGGLNLRHVGCRGGHRMKKRFDSCQFGLGPLKFAIRGSGRHYSDPGRKCGFEGEMGQEQDSQRTCNSHFYNNIA
jgi:hypothetical protein